MSIAGAGFGASKALEEILAGQMIKAQLAQQQQQEQARLALDQQRLRETTRRNDLSDQRTANIDRRANADDLASVLDSQFDPESSIDTEVSGEQQAELAGTPHAARVREIPTISARPVTPELEGSIDQTPQVGVRRMTPTGEQRAERRTVDLQRRTPPPDKFGDLEKELTIRSRFEKPEKPSKPERDPIADYEARKKLDQRYAQADKGAAEGRALEAMRTFGDDMLSVIDSLIDKEGNLNADAAGVIGGIGGARPEWAYGTEGSQGALSKIDRLQSMLNINVLQDMKSQSRTGATGFGALSERELSVIESSASTLRRRRQGDADYASELVRLRNAIMAGRGGSAGITIDTPPPPGGGGPLAGKKFTIVGVK